jgi:nucleotide-binding universal stress UspA family protein
MRTAFTPTHLPAASGCRACASRSTEERPVLACTAGDSASETVLRTAARIAGTNAREAQAIAVLEPLPLATGGFEVIPPPLALEDERRSALLGDVRQRLLAALGPESVWGVQVIGGQPARAIARHAAERHASLVIMGLGRHAIVDRLLGTETALQTMRIATVPVLAVPADQTAAMRHAVVAMDFSASAIRSARVALECLERPSLLTLVHVIPRLDAAAPFLENEWNEAYAKELPTLFERAKTAIAAPDGVVINTVTLRGDPAVELLAYVAAHDVDLIALGRRGLGAFERLLVGSVTTKVVRGATCAVLTSPTPAPSEVDEIERQLTRMLRSDDPAAWPARLADFTRRNIGRATHLEVDDPAFGAQSQETGWELRGVAYDHHDRRIEVMLGSDCTKGPHLTRSISGVDSVAILNDETGRDRALRLGHGRGQTILSFVE